MQVCTLEDKIIKVGGFTEQGQLVNRIDMYLLNTNEWVKIQPDARVKIPTEPGLVQISRNQIAMFGGYDEKGRKTSQCYIIS